MKIIVVKTCDGDIYYPDQRQADRVRAANAAAEQVLENDMGRYSLEDREAVQAAKTDRDARRLWSALVDARAVRVEELR